MHGGHSLMSEYLNLFCALRFRTSLFGSFQCREIAIKLMMFIRAVGVDALERHGADLIANSHIARILFVTERIGGLEKMDDTIGLGAMNGNRFSRIHRGGNVTIHVIGFMGAIRALALNRHGASFIAVPHSTAVLRHIGGGG